MLSVVRTATVVVGAQSGIESRGDGPEPGKGALGGALFEWKVMVVAQTPRSAEEMGRT